MRTDGISRVQIYWEPRGCHGIRRIQTLWGPTYHGMCHEDPWDPAVYRGFPKGVPWEPGKRIMCITSRKGKAENAANAFSKAFRKLFVICRTQSNGLLWTDLDLAYFGGPSVYSHTYQPFLACNCRRGYYLLENLRLFAFVAFLTFFPPPPFFRFFVTRTSRLCYYQVSAAYYQVSTAVPRAQHSTAQHTAITPTQSSKPSTCR